jgi:hypothetical protein
MKNLILRPENRVRFNDTELDVYYVNGERWLLGSQIVTAMGQSEQALRMLYKRHRSEFTSDMTAIVTVDTPAGVRQMRIFSPRGAALISMLTNSPKAVAFRVAVLDVLEGKAPPPLAGTRLRADGATARQAPPLMSADMAAALQKEILAGRPLWRRIARYRGLGLAIRDCAKLLEVSKDTLRSQVRRMEACGILTPPKNLARMQAGAAHFRASPRLRTASPPVLPKPDGNAHG